MPILSVVIPTHNRQRYAIDAIRTILDNFPDTEVVVSDTSDTRDLAITFAQSIESGRLIYSHTAEKLDVVRNFEKGLNLATGEYLIFLGDDDCLGPQAEQIAHWAKDNQIDAVGCTLGASYYWPDFRSKYFKDGYAAKLAVMPYSATVETIDAVAELQACLKDLGAGPAKMPRAYLGMVSRALTQKIQHKYGSFFGGVSPDIYSAALLAAECNQYVRLDFPFVIPGSSGASTSGQSASGGHKGKLRDNAHIGVFTNLVWDAAIPEFYSVQTVWSFSLLKAVEKISSNKLIPNFPRLYIRCLMFHRAHWAETFSAIKYTAERLGWLVLLSNMIIELIKEVVALSLKVGHRLFKPKATSNAVVIDGLSQISAGYQALAQNTQEPSVLLDLQKLSEEIKPFTKRTR